MTLISNSDLYCDNDEGLISRKAKGKWTLGKLIYLEGYINRFITSMRNKGWPSINYIDLFSGPGKNILIDDNSYFLGSPLIALSQKVSFDRYYFSDIDPNNIEVLKLRCANYSNFNKVKFDAGDANIIVNRVVMEIKSLNRSSTKSKMPPLNLAFLDPEGLELHWSTVEKLAKLRTDLIIYYSQMGISRNARKEYNLQPYTSIDRFFGDTYWRQIYQQYQGGGLTLHRPLLDYYKKKLEGFGYVNEFSFEPVYKNSKGGPMFRLLFVSKHTLGNQFWNDVTSKSHDGQMRLF